MKTKEVLEYLEKRIDIDHCRRVEALHVQALDYQKVDVLPLSIEYPPHNGFPLYQYNEAFEDPEKMLCRELVSIEDNIVNSVTIKDDYPLQIRGNYGIGIIASLFGAKLLVRGSDMPWVHHLEDKAFRAAVSKGIPDLGGGIARKVCEAYLRFAELLKDYPKCREAIKITQPDMQGSFDTLHMIRGNDAFTDMYDDPGMLHEALDIITETMIAYMRSIAPLFSDAAGEDNMYIHGAIYGGRVLIKDDTAFAMISESAYEEFCAPYNNRIFKAFGGTGSLHFCGSYKEWHPRQVEKQRIDCINFGNPEMHDLFSDWETLRKNKIKVAGYGEGQLYSFVKGCLEKGLRTGVTLKCKAESEDEAKRVLAEHYTNKDYM